VRLIFCSTLGNFLYFFSIMYNKILQSNSWSMWDELKHPDAPNSERLNIAICISCFMSNAQIWLFRAIWFFPYIFRIIRLKLIWGMQKKYYGTEVEGEEKDAMPSSSLRKSSRSESSSILRKDFREQQEKL